MASVSDVSSIVNILSGWFCQPVTRRISLLRSLSSQAEDLSTEATAIGGLKMDLSATVAALLAEDRRMEQSQQATDWFGSVDAVLESCRSFEDRFRNRRSSWNILRCGCSRNYYLAKDMKEQLERVRNLKEQGRSFTNENLVKQLPDMAVVLRDLQDKYESLSREIRTLKNLKEDKEARVKDLISQNPGKKEQSNEVGDWLRRTNDAVDSTENIRAKQAKNSPCSRTPGLYCSSEQDACNACKEKYCVGKEVNGLLQEAEDLKTEGRRFADAEQLVVSVPPGVVEQIPVDLLVFGQDEELKAVLRKLEDEEVKMVGICGMGGIGKTTLLRTINSHFFRNGAGGFDVILYTTAGRERVDIPRMQKEIGNRLRLSFSKDGQDVEEQARMILHSLQSMNFLLLLDDLWEKIDLGKLGIPPWSYVPERRRKMVMTARDEKVCTDMGVRERGMVRMDLLSDQDSWQLFSEKVGNDDVLRDPEIEALAGDVADKCGGLPLALATVGTAMASATEVHEWRNAKLELEKNARAVAGMEQEVLSPLKFSFDMLENDALRQILFLLLFALDGQRASLAFTVMLATHIAGEGLMFPSDDDKANIYDDNWESAVDKAMTMISRLVRSGLLMWHKHNMVRLHDCVRDLLRWLMDTDKDKHPQMVHWSSIPEKGTTERFHSFFGKWQHARRVSMEFCELEKIPEEIEVPFCPKLVQFSCVKTRIVHLPESFFYSMKSLRVLLLMCLGIDELPESIGSLINLKALELGYTPLQRLPKEIGDLKELKCLDLSCNMKLVDIPRECVSRLRRLEQFKIRFSAFEWRWSNNDGNGGRQQVALEDLKDLTENGSLRTIRISFWVIDAAIIDGLEHSPRLADSIDSLYLSMYKSNDVVMDMDRRLQALLSSSMKKLGTLYLSGPYSRSLLSQLQTSEQSLHAELRNPPPHPSFSSLRVLMICGCYGTFNLAWTQWIPRLQELGVIKCPDLTAFLSSEEQRSDSEYDNIVPFPHLRKLVIMHCRKLICIARCPSLEKLVVEDCPELKMLCLSEENAAKLKKIKGSKEWWDALEWQSGLLKSLFLPRFFQWTFRQSTGRRFLDSYIQWDTMVSN